MFLLYLNFENLIGRLYVFILFFYIYKILGESKINFYVINQIFKFQNFVT